MSHAGDKQITTKMAIELAENVFIVTSLKCQSYNMVVNITKTSSIETFSIKPTKILILMLQKKNNKKSPAQKQQREAPKTAKITIIGRRQTLAATIQSPRLFGVLRHS